MSLQQRKTGRKHLFWFGFLLFACVGFTWFGCATVTQSEECKAYVDCLAARDGQLKIQTDTLRFKPEGACWGGPEGADLCNRACKNGMVWLKSAYQNLPAACQ